MIEADATIVHISDSFDDTNNAVTKLAHAIGASRRLVRFSVSAAVEQTVVARLAARAVGVEAIKFIALPGAPRAARRANMFRVGWFLCTLACAPMRRARFASACACERHLMLVDSGALVRVCEWALDCAHQHVILMSLFRHDCCRAHLFAHVFGCVLPSRVRVSVRAYARSGAWVLELQLSRCWGTVAPLKSNVLRPAVSIGFSIDDGVTKCPAELAVLMINFGATIAHISDAMAEGARTELARAILGSTRLMRFSVSAAMAPAAVAGLACAALRSPTLVNVTLPGALRRKSNSKSSQTQ